MFKVDTFYVIRSVCSATVDTSERMRAVKHRAGTFGRRVRLGVGFATMRKRSVVLSTVCAEALSTTFPKPEEAAFVSGVAPSPAAATLGEAWVHNGFANGSVPSTDVNAVINESHRVSSFLRVPDIKPYSSRV